ncbi:MAG: ribosome small subunit-dependent GTPase A [Rhabdochlamydiaceae bacterium]|nr:ribosome small subunit-dependent GTPase A [Rhabdochlamydiaceae bacterium]
MSPKYDDILRYEEEFHEGEQKFSRKERKRITEGDRSKYKKTDQDQLKKNALVPTDSESELPKPPVGRVLSIHPEGVQVEYQEKLYRCSLKGTLKKEKSNFKNLVAVGDFVQFQLRGEEEGLIVHIEPRKSILSRADNLHRRKQQLIAVNIDQVIITSSIHYPPLKPFLIDRYIIAAQKGKMDPVIVINKIDLLQEDTEEHALLLECQEAYRALSIPFIMISIKTGQGVDELKKLMQNKSSVFSGQSGVGKSSLINTMTGMDLKTGGVVFKTFKGSHTTTTTQLIPLPNGGFCIDTPGIKSFGLWDLEESEIQHYFAEISELSSQCRFIGCSHQTEQDCAVKQAVEENKISFVRFASYSALIETVREEHRNR